MLSGTIFAGLSKMVVKAPAQNYDQNLDNLSNPKSSYSP